MISYECIISDASGHTLDYEQPRNDVHRWQSSDNWVLPDAVTEPIGIGGHVWIGARVIILRGVSVGEMAIVGAGAVVTHDFPAWSVVAGNPARVMRKQRQSDEAQAEDAERGVAP